MAKNIEPNLKKVGSYLKLDQDAIFIIPEYQRAYSWGKERCEKLWDDIVEFSENDDKDPYFFGTVILSCEKGDSELYLIDGQQRTTTFFLLLKALLIKTNQAILNTASDEESAELCRGLRQRRRDIIQILYRVDEEDIPDQPDPVYDAKLYQNVALMENRSMLEQFKDDFTAIMKASTLEEAAGTVAEIKYRKKDNRYSNFFRNFKYFMGEVNALSDSHINAIAKTIIKRCEIIEIRSWQLEQAITMFNSLNSDNLPLRDADIISSKLFAAAKGDGVEKTFSDTWEHDFLNLANRLEDREIVDVDAILMEYMYYLRAKNGDTISETGKINVTTPGLRRYFTDINKKSLDAPLDFATDVITLAENWGRAYDGVPAVQVLLKFNENAKLFFASFLYRFRDEFSENDVKVMAESLIRLFTILEVTGANYSSKNFKTFLFGEQVKMLSPQTSVEEIKADFAKHISSGWAAEQIEEYLKDYDGNMLVYLNEYLFAASHNYDFDLLKKYDVEHIMSASGRNLQTIRTDANIYGGDGKSAEEEFEEYVNQLGNKILLEYSINRSIGNEWFRTKVSTTLEDKTGYVDSKYPLAQALVEEYRYKDKKYWTKEDIAVATDKAISRIMKFIFEN